MWELVLLTGLLITGGSAYSLVRTDQLLGLVNRVLSTRWIYLAALFRVLLGAALIASAHTVAYPHAIAFIGWLVVLGGLLLVAVPQGFWMKMGHGMAKLPTGLLRLGSLIGLSLGGFILYVALL